MLVIAIKPMSFLKNLGISVLNIDIGIAMKA